MSQVLALLFEEVSGLTAFWDNKTGLKVPLGLYPSAYAFAYFGSDDTLLSLQVISFTFNL